MILVTGATGLVGRLLIEELEAGGAQFRAVSRNPKTTEEQGDPSNPETLAVHLEGVTTLFLHARAVGEAAAELVDLAKRKGVRRVVALAAINVDDDTSLQPSRMRGDRNREADRAAAGSGLEWVSLRPSAYASNALGFMGAQIRAGDVVRGPYADFAETPLHERDLAQVAARALLDDGISGRLELTGPQALTHTEMVEIIGAAIGRPLRYQEVPPEQAARGMVANGLPEPFVEALMRRYTDGLGAFVTDEVQRVLGRPATPFAQWAAENAEAFK
ncbi:NAD(P)H-binding protein [Nonomuraea sp. NPDC050556]|uniref:NAD(P)H-binding protein n=1 Tax=Nonomuraea sp. NPDC050556 TaxID=3364369 RepID=UPI003787E181